LLSRKGSSVCGDGGERKQRRSRNTERIFKNTRKRMNRKNFGETKPEAREKTGKYKRRAEPKKKKKKRRCVQRKRVQKNEKLGSEPKP